MPDLGMLDIFTVPAVFPAASLILSEPENKVYVSDIEISPSNKITTGIIVVGVIVVTYFIAAFLLVDKAYGVCC